MNRSGFTASFVFALAIIFEMSYGADLQAAPKINPHVSLMRQRIAESLDLAPERVGIKATTNELMGFIGRGEGIAAMAVASVWMEGD